MRREKRAFDWVVSRGDGDLRLTFVVDGNNGWSKIGGMAATVASSEELEVYTGDTHALWVASLLPLKEKVFTLTVLPETNINSNPAVGFKASYRNRPDVSLYFDKTTGLLVRTTFKGKEAGAFVVKECTYSDYKEFGSLKLPSKQMLTADGRKAVEWKESSYDFADTFPKELFAKP